MSEPHKRAVGKWLREEHQPEHLRPKPEGFCPSHGALTEIKLELFDLQSRVTTGNIFKFLILLTLLGIWGTILCGK